jgi:hypothetical protein
MKCFIIPNQNQGKFKSAKGLLMPAIVRLLSCVYRIVVFMSL